MNGYVSLGFISLLLLILFAGVCIAEDASGSVVYVQGGESIITHGSDETYLLNVQDVIPYIHVSDGVRSHLESVEFLPVFSYPIDAAVVFSGVNGESGSLLKILNVTVSKEKNDISVTVIPLRYYEGKILQSFASENMSIDTFMESKINKTAIYFEMNPKPLKNGCNYPCPGGCFWSEADKSCWTYDETDTFVHCPGC